MPGSLPPALFNRQPPLLAKVQEFFREGPPVLVMAAQCHESGFFHFLGPKGGRPVQDYIERSGPCLLL